MTSIELMNNLADYLQQIVDDYSSNQKAGAVPVAVYSGWPPVRKNAAEKESFIYALALSWEDKEDDSFSTCKVEIGFSIYDNDETEGCFSLYNIMEHVRQALLKKRTLSGRNRLELPLKSEVTDEQAFPQWYGRITAVYTIGQPSEEEVDYGEIYGGQTIGDQ
nr:MAG TPA: tail completion protein [Caudoviricetes sp.]